MDYNNTYLLKEIGYKAKKDFNISIGIAILILLSVNWTAKTGLRLMEVEINPIPIRD